MLEVDQVCCADVGATHPTEQGHDQALTTPRILVISTDSKSFLRTGREVAVHHPVTACLLAPAPAQIGQ
jgi:hypothetical protein